MKKFKNISVIIILIKISSLTKNKYNEQKLIKSDFWVKKKAEQQAMKHN